MEAESDEHVGADCTFGNSRDITQENKEIAKRACTCLSCYLLLSISKERGQLDLQIKLDLVKQVVFSKTALVNRSHNKNIK